MAQRARTAGNRSRKARVPGDEALERLHDSIDAAQAALKHVRSEVSRGSRELLGDVETTLSEPARRKAPARAGAGTGARRSTAKK